MSPQKENRLSVLMSIPLHPIPLKLLPDVPTAEKIDISIVVTIP